MPNDRGDRDHESRESRSGGGDNRFNSLFSERERLQQEDLDTLSGKRPKERKRSAVRIEDLNGILQMPPKPQAVGIGAAPTAAQYNLLKRDVEKLYAQLAIVAAALQGKLTPPLPKSKITYTPS